MPQNSFAVCHAFGCHRIRSINGCPSAGSCPPSARRLNTIHGMLAMSSLINVTAQKTAESVIASSGETRTPDCESMPIQLDGPYQKSSNGSALLAERAGARTVETRESK